MGRSGLLFIISGPSGTGKTSLGRELVRQIPKLQLSVSYTTRPPRKDEIHGQDYLFVSSETFRAMINKGELAEWAEIYGHFYGTARSVIEQTLAKGHDLLFNIDAQGAKQLKKIYPQGISIFVLPPSLAELERRLQERNTDSPEIIKNRLSRAQEEISQANTYDYIVVNDSFAETLRVLQAIIISERHRREHMLKRLPILNDFLKY